MVAMTWAVGSAMPSTSTGRALLGVRKSRMQRTTVDTFLGR
jgi:hypothetical protein